MHSTTVARLCLWLSAMALAIPALAAGADVSLAKQCPAATAWMNAHPHEHTGAAAVDGTKGKVARPKLRAELERMSAEDEKTRSALIAGGNTSASAAKAITEADRRHLQRLKKIVAVSGFPTAAEVGVGGVQAAWLLVQHADSDPAFQAKMLADIAPRAGAGGIRPRDVAMLTDRVLAAQGKPQRYGSQFRMHDGHLQPRPVEGPDNLDKRRARVGMMPLADYACMLSVVYKTPVSTTPAAGATGSTH